MLAIGHLALGYLTGKATSSALKVNLNLPLVFLVSILPDADLFLQRLMPTLIVHRVEVHSILLYTAVFLPVFLLYGKRAAPYFVALLSHSLIGDFLTGGTALFWPLTATLYGVPTIEVTSLLALFVELSLFAGCLFVLVFTGDLKLLLKPRKSSLFLVVPSLAVLAMIPTLGRVIRFEGIVPVLLLISSLFLLIVFSIGIFGQIGRFASGWLRAIRSALYVYFTAVKVAVAQFSRQGSLVLFCKNCFQGDAEFLF
jgi:hypothetical protein